MKNTLKIFLFGLGAIALGTVIIGLLLPSVWRADASVEIKADPAAIHPHVASFKAWESWANAALKENDPDAEITYSGPEAGVGATMSWNSQKMGSGRMTITESDPATGIRYEAAMGGDEINAHGSIRYEKTEAGTRVSWHDEGELTPVVGGLFAGPLNDALSKHFADSLGKLKSQVEGD